MYIVLRGRKVASFHKFSTEYDAKVWCLHNGLGYYVKINNLGDKIIKLKNGVNIEKIG